MSTTGVATTLGTVAIALAGIALSITLDTWTPTWVGSLAGLGLVLVLLGLRRRRTTRGGGDRNDNGDDA